MTANEKRLAKMRENLEALEKRAEAILEKGDAMTAADRMTLLFIVNIAYHTSGKIEGVFSVDGSASCEFCAKMRKAAEKAPLMICGYCYAAADEWKEAAWRRHKLNARILSSVLFTADELSALPIAGLLCRINEDGDIVNHIHAQNVLRIAASRPSTNFGFWYKNAADVEKALRLEGYTSRAALPNNVHFIHSSALIGVPAAELWFDDAIFTVWPDKATTEEAIKAGAHECNGRKCAACGYKCYTMDRAAHAIHIAEYLRTNAARRAAVLKAYDEYVNRA